MPDTRQPTIVLSCSACSLLVAGSLIPPEPPLPERIDCPICGAADACTVIYTPAEEPRHDPTQPQPPSRSPVRRRP